MDMDILKQTGRYLLCRKSSDGCGCLRGRVKRFIKIVDKKKHDNKTKNRRM
jgi:hypothetical protein